MDGSLLRADAVDSASLSSTAATSDDESSLSPVSPRHDGSLYTPVAVATTATTTTHATTTPHNNPPSPPSRLASINTHTHTHAPYSHTTAVTTTPHKDGDVEGGNGGDDPEEQKQSFRKSLFKVVVSGVGFFSDAYDIFIINIVLVILHEKYKMETIYKTLISSAAVAGAVTGMLLFGWLGDKLGRKKGFIATLTLVVVGAATSAAAFSTPVTPIFVSLAVFQFMLGIGIGGEYPLSATITAESSNAGNRGRMLSAVFAMQGVGQLAAALVSFTLLSTVADRGGIDLVWRLCVGVGAIPGIMMFYFRVMMEETPHFGKKTKPIKWSNILKSYGPRLFGTAASWGLFDITFYANGLFAATVLSMFGVGENEDQTGKLIDISKFNIYIALMALPGYVMAFIFIDKMGRKGMQIFGFIMIAILYVTLGVLLQTVPLDKLRWIAIALYGGSFFCSNFGPNSTTFILPSECFPTQIRARCHGISAATGKLGAVIGAAVMSPLLDMFGLHIVLYICGAIALTGCAVTVFFVVETSGKSLQELTIPMDDDDDDDESASSGTSSCSSSCSSSPNSSRRNSRSDSRIAAYNAGDGEKDTEKQQLLRSGIN